MFLLKTTSEAQFSSKALTFHFHPPNNRSSNQWIEVSSNGLVENKSSLYKMY